jgi:membrane protease YdiL (CAAX protease family)
MKTIWRVVLILIGFSVLACLLYPLVYTLLVQGFSWDYESDRIFRRVWMFSCLAGLLIFHRPLGMQKPVQAGFGMHGGSLKNLLIGFLLSCLFLAALTALYVWMGDNIYYVQEDKIWKRFRLGVIQGLLVGFIEEYIFRGLIFYSFLKRWNWLPAAILTSLIFASLHFLEGHGDVEAVDPSAWNAGFVICGMMLRNMFHEFILFPDALGLFSVGMILCDAAYRTGSLWYGTGLHAGWVFFTKFRTPFVYFAPDADQWLIGGGRMFNGVIPIVAIFIIFPLTHWLVRSGWLSKKP